jgi:hypothetical protein
MEFIHVCLHRCYIRVRPAFDDVVEYTAIVDLETNEHFKFPTRTDVNSHASPHQCQP